MALMSYLFRDSLGTYYFRRTIPVGLRPFMPAPWRRDLKGYALPHASTINKHRNILAAIVSHAGAAGKLDAVPGFRNPFGKGTRLGLDDRAEEARRGFTATDLASIFGTGVFTSGDRPGGGGGEAAFWLPILALLSGARQGELAQLRMADLARDDETGIWHFDIKPGEGRSIKTASSRRKVPLHPVLESIGLLRYRDSLVDAGSGPYDPLWPDLRANIKAQPVAAWSKWFNRHLRVKAGIADSTKVFHSFRHTFKRLARSARIMEELHDALTGHSGGGDVGRTYASGFALPAMAEELARIEVPETVRGLRWVASQPASALK